MRALMKLAMLILPFLLLGGCWDRTELNDLSLITALAFDKVENNMIQATAQLIIPQNQSGSGMMGAGGSGGGTAKKTTISFEKGFNIADALSKLQRKTTRKLFWGQCKIFIISDTLAKKGIHEQFDFLVRHPQPRERAYMFVSKGKAADALEVFPSVERSSSDALRKLSDLQTGFKITLEQLSQMLRGDSQAAALPIVKILPPKKSATDPLQTIPYIMGIAIFNKDAMIGELSGKVTRGVMWVRNEIQEYTVTYKTDETEGLVSLNPVKASVKLIPEIVGDQWMMTIKVNTEGDIVQNSTLLNPLSPDLLILLDKAFAKDVKERILQATNEVQHKWKVDIFDFAKEFHRKYPKQWEKEKNNWNELFPKVVVKVDIQAHILRPGLINSPAGVPMEEVKGR
ncbi:Ger(x)C family spore germination protein [Paenibacillus radicis (ex Xue et al. 2023)]|uniref:Ger(X)C family spore germination protein n=1 Tax=Paenibacillus radicis (ex Xue et al. 2023) TaxID=2972489 RepID=A0ABT1YPD9_9BACL|nr:Ger(x)C family spore germination protein [Paenibacillus radicis (ex Xue et al. 2023)]MCR8635041.1 Ger(x)C family spore germination protein [Paenibacillus radicis (ex Xue et al. 2023)]